MIIQLLIVILLARTFKARQEADCGLFGQHVCSVYRTLFSRQFRRRNQRVYKSTLRDINIFSAVQYIISPPYRLAVDQ